MENNFKNIIPNQGIYIQNGNKFYSGDVFPDIQDGDIYLYQDYVYKYNYRCVNQTFEPFNSQNGWGVQAASTIKMQYGEILEKINGKNVVSLDGTFWDCKNLLYPPKIPKNIVSMIGTFMDCTALVDYPIIPVGVKVLWAAFYNCKNLKTAPVIPDGVLDIRDVFYNCSQLSGTVFINSDDVEQFSGCFGNVVNHKIMLKGTENNTNLRIALSNLHSNISVV